MSLRFSIAPGQIKHFKNSLQCLAKIGTEVLLEAVPERMVLRCINSSKSAFMSVTFHSAFFESYDVFDAPVLQTAVLMKNLLAAFRTPKVSRMIVEASLGDDPRISIGLACDNGLTKRYVLPCVEAEILTATVDRDAFPTSVIAEAQELNRLLASFHSGLEEITIIAYPQEGPSQGGGDHSRSCELRSFLDPLRGGRDKVLKTAVAVDARALFRGYRHDSEGATDVTFNLRDLRAIVSLCEHMQAHACIAFDQPGVPVLVQPHFGGVEGAQYEGELVLATLTESQLEYEAGPPPGGRGGNGMADTGGGNGATTSYIPGDTPWRSTQGRTPISKRTVVEGQTPTTTAPGSRATANRPSRLAQSTFSEPPAEASPATTPQPSHNNPDSHPGDSAGIIRFHNPPAATPATDGRDRMDVDGGPEVQDRARVRWRGVEEEAEEEEAGGARSGSGRDEGANGYGSGWGRGQREVDEVQEDEEEEGEEGPYSFPSNRVRELREQQRGQEEGVEEEEMEEDDEMPPTPPEKRLRSAGPGIISTLP